MDRDVGSLSLFEFSGSGHIATRRHGPMKCLSRPATRRARWDPSFIVVRHRRLRITIFIQGVTKVFVNRFCVDRAE